MSCQRVLICSLCHQARVVPPSEPRIQLGIYWGYRVRVARGINRVLKEGPFKVQVILFKPSYSWHPRTASGSWF